MYYEHLAELIYEHLYEHPYEHLYRGAELQCAERAGGTERALRVEVRGHDKGVRKGVRKGVHKQARTGVRVRMIPANDPKQLLLLKHTEY